MENNLLNEEINRIGTLMKLPINEDTRTTIQSILNLAKKAQLAADDLVMQNAKRIEDFLQANPKNVTGALERVKNLEATAKEAVQTAKNNLDDLLKQKNPPAKASEIQKATQNLKNKTDDLDEITRANNDIQRTYGLKGTSASSKLIAAADKITSTNVYSVIRKLFLGGVSIYSVGYIIARVKRFIGNNACIYQPEIIKKIKNSGGTQKYKEGSDIYESYIKNIENEELRKMYPKGIVLQFGYNNNKVFEISTGKKVGTWYADNSCNIYIKKGAVEFKLFGGQGQQPTPTPDEGGGRRRGGGAITYKLCTGVYSYTCFSEKIKELQRCVGVKDDGYWGPDTKTAVENKFGVQKMTDAQIDQFCKAQPVTPPQPTPQPAPQQPRREELGTDIFTSGAPTETGSSVEFF